MSSLKHEQDTFYHRLTRCQKKTLFAIRSFVDTLLYSQVAVPDVVEAAKDADILIFVIPHQFIKGLGAQMVGKIKPSAIGLSLIKGFDVAEGGGIELISHIITKHLKVSSSTVLKVF
jgi:glycerol-3-phosphate dehydrogenase